VVRLIYDPAPMVVVDVTIKCPAEVSGQKNVPHGDTESVPVWLYSVVSAKTNVGVIHSSVIAIRARFFIMVAVRKACRTVGLFVYLCQCSIELATFAKSPMMPMTRRNGQIASTTQMPTEIACPKIT